MDFTEVAKFFKDVGFPAAIAVFVLWRLDGTLKSMVAELRAFRESTVLTTTDLKEHMTEQATRVIREADHNVRSALAHIIPSRREP